jgi:hypothetical protein
MFECAFAGPLDNWSIGDGIAERHAQFNGLSAGTNSCERNFA